MPARLALGALAMAATLGTGCLSDGGRSPRRDDTCFIGGCNAEVCSDRAEVFTPCIWRESYACYSNAICDRQPDGACGWTPTPELAACLASHAALPGSP